MKFHFPSFVLGYGAGAATVLLGERLRPFLVELAKSVYQLGDALGTRLAAAREDADDVLAEGRARARKPHPQRRRHRA